VQISLWNMERTTTPQLFSSLASHPATTAGMASAASVHTESSNLEHRVQCIDVIQRLKAGGEGSDGRGFNWGLGQSAGRARASQCPHPASLSEFRCGECAADAHKAGKPCKKPFCTDDACVKDHHTAGECICPYCEQCAADVHKAGKPGKNPSCEMCVAAAHAAGMQPLCLWAP
jgi:hypothetical protein